MTAPSTAETALGFQTLSLYTLAALPDTSNVNSVFEAFHDSERTRSPRLALPRGGSSFDSVKPKSFFTRMTRLFGPPYTGNRSDKCWSLLFGCILNGKGRPFISTLSTCVRRLNAGEKSTQQSPVLVRLVASSMLSSVL